MPTRKTWVGGLHPLLALVVLTLAVTRTARYPSTPHDSARTGDVMANAALITSDIVKRFGKRLVLDRAELVLCPGEVVAIVGENGVGKNSLLRICAGLLAADAGTLERHARIGYCPKEPAPFDSCVAKADNKGWSLYGAPWLQPLAINRK